MIAHRSRPDDLDEEATQVFSAGLRSGARIALRGRAPDQEEATQVYTPEDLRNLIRDLDRQGWADGDGEVASLVDEAELEEGDDIHEMRTQVRHFARPPSEPAAIAPKSDVFPVFARVQRTLSSELAADTVREPLLLSVSTTETLPPPPPPPAPARWPARLAACALLAVACSAGVIAVEYLPASGPATAAQLASVLSAMFR